MPANEEPAAAPDWLGPRTAGDRRMLYALAAALALHLMPLLAASGGLVLLGIGAPPSEIGVGDPAGKPEGVNVEMIDGADFNRRYVAFDRGPSTPPTPPAESEPSKAMPPRPQPQQQQQEPQQQQKQAQQTLPQPEAAEPPSSLLPALRQETLPAEIATPTEKPVEKSRPIDRGRPMTAADIEELVEMTRPDRPMAIQLVDQASGARQGVSSEFTRSVVRKIKAVLPEPKGVKGLVVIGFMISDAGEPIRITVLQASAYPAFDNTVVERIRATRFMVPDKSVRPNERIVKFSYEFS